MIEYQNNDTVETKVIEIDMSCNCLQNNPEKTLLTFFKTTLSRNIPEELPLYYTIFKPSQNILRLFNV